MTRLKTPNLKLSPRTAAPIAGIAFIVSIIIVTWVDDFLLGNFVIPGDTDALTRDIQSNPKNFGYAVSGYLVVLGLDAIIGLALYAVLRPARPTLALIAGSLRLFYAGTVAMAVIALNSQIIDVYGYAMFKDIGYVIFALHIFVLGYAVLKTDYIPNALGYLLIVAALTYSVFFVDVSLSAALSVIFMIIMGGAELTLSLWLIVKRNRLPEAN